MPNNNKSLHSVTVDTIRQLCLCLINRSKPLPSGPPRMKRPRGDARIKHARMKGRISASQHAPLRAASALTPWACARSCADGAGRRW